MEDIAAVHRQVQKLIPFHLNILLDVTGSSSSNGGGSGRRKQSQSTGLNQRTLDKSLFNPSIIRCVVNFRLHVVKVALLQYRLTDLEPNCSNLVTQMRAALTWLEKDFGGRLFNKTAAQLTPGTYAGVLFDDVLMYILAVACIVNLQIMQISKCHLLEKDMD